MSAEYIRNYYKVPAWRGRRVRFTGGRESQLGTIVGFRDQYLRVRFDGDRAVATLHPTWEIEYVPVAAGVSAGAGGEQG